MVHLILHTMVFSEIDIIDFKNATYPTNIAFILYLGIVRT